MNLGRVDEAFDLDDLGALELDLREIIRAHDHVLLRLELVAFDDFIVRERLAALLALLLVADGPVILLVQLVEANRLLRIDGVVDANRNRHQRKPDVAFPDGSHRAPRGVTCSGFMMTGPAAGAGRPAREARR